jgi:hypothetical protein
VTEEVRFSTKGKASHTMAWATLCGTEHWEKMGQWELQEMRELRAGDRRDIDGLLGR